MTTLTTTDGSRTRFTSGAFVAGHGWPVKAQGVLVKHVRTRRQAQALVSLLNDANRRLAQHTLADLLRHAA